MKNSFTDFLIAFTVTTFLLFVMIKSVSFSDDTVESKFNVMDRVYVLPDSISATIERKTIITVKEKIDGVKERVIISETYTIMYTDKTGTIHRFKNISPNHLVKKH